MIDHLEIESTTILIESRSGKMQIAEYGIPEPPNGKKIPNDIIVNNLFVEVLFFFLESLESQNARIALIESCKAEFGGDFQATGKNSSNQFSFIERANQSMIDETDDREIQTDPPPM